MKYTITIAGGTVTADGDLFAADGKQRPLSDACRVILEELVIARGAFVENEKIELRLAALRKSDEPLAEYLRKQVEILRRELGHLLVVNGRNQYRLVIPQNDSLSVDQLAELEAPEEEKGHLKHGAFVYVHAAQPTESLPDHEELAERVVRNLRAGISYHYFMGKEPRLIAQLVAALVNSVRSTAIRATPTPASKYEFLGSKLRIFQVQDFLPFDFFVHNATDVYSRECYVRKLDTPRVFLKWGSGAGIGPLVDAQSSTVPANFLENDAIIQQSAGSQPVDLKKELEQQIVSQLKSRGLSRQEIPEVIALCFPEKLGSL